MLIMDTDELIAEARKSRSRDYIDESDDIYEYVKSEMIHILEILQQEETNKEDK